MCECACTSIHMCVAKSSHTDFAIQATCHAVTLIKRNNNNIGNKNHTYMHTSIGGCTNCMFLL